MNRPVGAPQSLRGLPSGFNAQPQPMPPVRSVSGRLPNGKLGNNGPGWAFGSGVPLGSAAVQNPARSQPMGGNISFAQSLGGSQPATPLDLSEFPSLSNNAQMASNGQSSLWSSAGSRNIGQGIQRASTNPLAPQQQGHQEDMFGAVSRPPNQSSGSFRFGQVAASTQPGSIDDFPPLNNRASAAGEIGQDRSQSLMAGVTFGAQPPAATAPIPDGRSGNGLLNALSANSRSGAEARAPVGTRPSETRGLATEDDGRSKSSGFADGRTAQPPAADAAPTPALGLAPTGARMGLGAIGIDGAKAGSDASQAVASAKDPLAGMAPTDKWGMKGLQALITKDPSYSAALSGLAVDLSTLNVDLATTEMLSTQVYSIFDGLGPRPAVPKFRLPECYKVSNVGPIENKITSFNEETLMWIFYSCPNDIKQQLAAIELTNRNWRWHKRQQIWLTKDDMMMPQVLSQSHERGFYIIWDPVNWRKERTTREITLNYADLDNSPISTSGAV